MKNKLTNFGVYIVKNLFASVYDRIYSSGYSEGWDHALGMHNAAQDDIIMGPEEPDMYDVLYDSDGSELRTMQDEITFGEFINDGYSGYGGEDTRADFLEWRAQKPHYEGEGFINEWMATEIDHNVWIGDVSLAEPSRITQGTWEIYSRNILFEDCERYNDKVSALLRIYWLQNVYPKKAKA